MASSSNISASGQIKNTLHMGFTPLDALKELIDNAHDAGATECRIRISSPLKTLYVDDDGKGMDPKTLHLATRFHNTSPASGSIGCRGFGLNAAHIRISSAASTTRIFTRIADSPVHETALNWNQYLDDDLYNPQVTDLTVARQSEWVRGALNLDHGTVTMIPMTEELFTEMTKQEFYTGMLDEIGRAYEKHIRGGFRITFAVDGTVHKPDFSRALNYEDTPINFRNEVPIELWRNPETKEERIYYWHDHGKPVWSEMVRDNPASRGKKDRLVRDYAGAPADGFTRVASVKLRSTYNPLWNPPACPPAERPPPEEGYISFCRNGRHLRTIANEHASSGDFEKRRVIAAHRHSLLFTHEADDLINISVNKSQVIVDNVHQGLLKFVLKYTKAWAGNLYERNWKTAKAATTPDDTVRNLKNARRILETLAKDHPGWYEDFCSWADSLSDDEDSDSNDSPK
jgi:hypothetical protein